MLGFGRSHHQGLSLLRAFEGNARTCTTTCLDEEHDAMTPLQIPWTQPKPTLPLDVLNPCNSTPVSRLNMRACLSVAAGAPY